MDSNGRLFEFSFCTLRDAPSENFGTKSIFFLAAIFPGLVEKLPRVNPFLTQFCSAEGKPPFLIKVFSTYSKIPIQDSYVWKKWVLAIHQLEDVINQNVVSDELKNALRSLAQDSNQAQIDQLPETAKKFFNELRSESPSPA